jgi:AcrR family transcriptional regulator
MIKRKPASRYHHGDLRRALLQEAVRTIAGEGVEGLTLREVGRRLGVSRTALYRHFADKSSLLAAVSRDGFIRFRDDLQQAWDEHPASRRGLDSMGLAYVNFAMAHPAHYRVMFGGYRDLSDKDPELQTVAADAFDVLVQALLSMQKAGLVRRDEPRLLAHYIWAVVHGIAMLAIDGQLGPPAAASEQLSGLVQLAFERLHTGIAMEKPARPATRTPARVR